jgi:hypothetical protein
MSDTLTENRDIDSHSCENRMSKPVSLQCIHITSGTYNPENVELVDASLAPPRKIPQTGYLIVLYRTSQKNLSLYLKSPPGRILL